MKVFTIVLSVLILAPLGLCVALPIGINEVKARNWELLYRQLHHPPGTDRILLRAGIEKFSNGDNCDFVIMEARSYTLGDENLIQAYYGEQPNPVNPRSNSLRPSFFVTPAADEKIDLYDDFAKEVARTHNGPYYQLEAWEVVESAPPLVDWRCP